MSVTRSYAHRKDVTQDQMLQLHAFLLGEDVSGMSSGRCREVADQLGMPFEAVRFWSGGVGGWVVLDG